MNERPAARRLSGQDAVFIYGETETMPMHTMGTVILDPSDVPGGFGFEEIVRTVESRIHLMPPFRQRLLEVPLGLGHPMLVDDPDFEVRQHLRRMAVPAPGGMRELAEIVGELAAGPLERDQPLWRMWSIEGLKGGRIALVTKMHHCMIDGASGSSQMASLMDLQRDAEPPEPAREPWSPPSLPGPLSLAASSIGSRLVNPLTLGRLVRETARGMQSRRRAEQELQHPPPEGSNLLDTAPQTPFNRALTRRRAVAYGSVPLEDVKRVKKAFGVTVNDAVLAASTLTLRRYLQRRGALPDEPLVCVVPLSLKTSAEKQEFSNKVSGLSIHLPTNLEDPAEIVRAIHRETSDAKEIQQAAEEDVLPQWLEFLPPLLTTWGVHLYSDFDLADRVPSMWNVVVSNMMGPPVPLYFGGARVEAVYPMGPAGEGMGLNVTLLSNTGRLDVGVLSCPELVPDPWEIADGFGESVTALLGAAGEAGPGPIVD